MKTNNTTATLREKLLAFFERKQAFSNNTYLSHDEARELVYGEEVDEILDLLKSKIPEKIDTAGRSKLYIRDEAQMWYDKGQNDMIERFKRALGLDDE